MDNKKANQLRWRKKAEDKLKAKNKEHKSRNKGFKRRQ